MIDNIKLKPKRIITSKDKLIIAKICEPNFKILLASEFGYLGNIAYKRLVDGLSDIVKCNASNAYGKIDIILKISNIIPQEVKCNVEQAYKVYVDNTSVRIIGFSDLGLYYGVTTFLQALDVINNRVEIQKMLLLDYPDIRTRGYIIADDAYFALMDLDDFKFAIDDMSSKKLNHLALPFYRFYNQANTPFGKSVTKKYYSPKKKGWLTEAAQNHITEANFGDALIKYGIEHGIEVLPYIEILNTSNILDFTEDILIKESKDDKTEFCVLKSKSYNRIFEIFDTLIDNCLKPNNIETVRLCSSKEDNATNILFNSCECRECKRLTYEDKISRYLINVLRYLKERGMKNVYVDPSFILNSASACDFKDLLVMENLRDVAIFEINSDANKSNIIKEFVSDAELRTFIKPIIETPSEGVSEDFIENAFTLAETAINDGAEALQAYSFFDSSLDIYHSAIANFAWNKRGSFSAASFKEFYLLCEFRENMKEISEALQIYENFKSTCGQLERVKFIFSKIRYYDKIVSPNNKSNFPGDMIKLMIDERKEFETELKEAYRLSNRAYEIFAKAENNISGNYEVAHRLATEMKYYRELTLILSDFLSINDLSKSQRLTPAIIKKILALINERKEGMINVMRDIENSFEKYLVPSLLRGISVIFQLFCDIEAHYETANGRDRRIDMTDLRPIASHLFKFIL